jgi:hypothetical protein
MRRALHTFVVEGLYTSIPLHRRILGASGFEAGKIDTGFLGGAGLWQKSGKSLRLFGSGPLSSHEVVAAVVDYFARIL